MYELLIEKVDDQSNGTRWSSTMLNHKNNVFMTDFIWIAQLPCVYKGFSWRRKLQFHTLHIGLDWDVFNVKVQHKRSSSVLNHLVQSKGKDRATEKEEDIERSRKKFLEHLKELQRFICCLFWISITKAKGKLRNSKRKGKLKDTEKKYWKNSSILPFLSRSTHTVWFVIEQVKIPKFLQEVLICYTLCILDS